jgi:hypothetical protein
LLIGLACTDCGVEGVQLRADILVSASGPVNFVPTPSPVFSVQFSVLRPFARGVYCVWLSAEGIPTVSSPVNFVPTPSPVFSVQFSDPVRAIDGVWLRAEGIVTASGPVNFVPTPSPVFSVQFYVGSSTQHSHILCQISTIKLVGQQSDYPCSVRLSIDGAVMLRVNMYRL